MSKTSKSVYKGKALSLLLEKVNYPDGSSGVLEIIRHPGGAAVVALNTDNEVCLIKQYRFAADGWIWEIPAGRIEQNEDPIQTAKRELEEEAGVKAGHWETLAVFYPSPGICDERIYIYIAKELSAIPFSHEPDEYIEIHWVPFTDAIKWIQQGKIVDAKTIISLLYTQSFIAAQ